MSEELTTEGKFNYLEKGEGEVILILHGLFGALSNFKEVTNHFSKKYKVVIPILPIYDLPIINTNVKALAKFIKEFVEYKGFDKVHILGNSLGGHVGLVYSNEHPDKIHSVTLAGSSGLYENAFGGSFPKREDKEYLRAKIALTFHDPAMVTDEVVEECYEAVNNRGKIIRILAIAKSAIRHNMSDVLKDYKMPFCIIWGKNDNVTPPEVAEEFHENIPQSELFWIDKCGHAPMMEHPQEFIDLYDAWMTKTFGA